MKAAYNFLIITLAASLVGCGSTFVLIEQPDPVITRCSIPGVVAITFDDGPFFTTPGVLDVLKEKNVTATFFINGANWMDIYNDTAQGFIRRTVAEGHTIGSHTWSHPNLTEASPDRIRSEMSLLSESLERLNLTTSRPTLMRPPWGAYDDQVIQIVATEFNYTIVNWSISTKDWEHPGDTQAGVQGYLDVLNGTDPATTLGFISLHHDVQVGSSELASAVIDVVRDLGYSFVSLSECLGDP